MKKLIIILFLISLISVFYFSQVSAEETKLSNDFKFILNSTLYISVQSNLTPEIAEAFQYSLNSKDVFDNLKEETKKFLSSLNITSTSDKELVYLRILNKTEKENNKTASFINTTVLFLKKLQLTVNPLNSLLNIAEIQENYTLINCKLRQDQQDISFLLDLEPERLKINPAGWEIHAINGALELTALSSAKAILDGFSIANVEEGTRVYFHYDNFTEISELWFSEGSMELAINNVIFKSLNQGYFTSYKKEDKWSIDSFEISTEKEQKFSLPLDEGQLNFECLTENPCNIYYEGSGFITGSNLLIDNKFIEEFSAEFNQKGEIEKILLSPKARYSDLNNSFSLYSKDELIVYFIETYLFYEENAIMIEEDKNNVVFTINANVLVNRGKPLTFAKSNDAENQSISLIFPEEGQFGQSKKNFIFLYRAKKPSSKSDEITAFSIDAEGNILSASFGLDKKPDLSESAKKILVLGEEETQRRLNELKADFRLTLSQINNKKETIRRELENKALYEDLTNRETDRVNRAFSDAIMLSTPSPDISPIPGQQQIIEQQYANELQQSTACWISAARISEGTIEKLEAQIDDLILNYERNYQKLIKNLKELMSRTNDKAKLQEQINVLEDNLKISKIQLLLAAGRNDKVLQETALLSSRVSELKPYFRGVVYAQKGDFVLANQEWAKVNTEEARLLVEEAKRAAFSLMLTGAINKYAEDYQSRGANIQNLRGIAPQEGMNRLEFLYGKLNVFEWVPELGYSETKITLEQNRLNYDKTMIDGLGVINDLVEKGYDFAGILNIGGFTLASPQFSQELIMAEVSPSFVQNFETEYLRASGQNYAGIQKIKQIYGYGDTPEENRKAILTFLSLQKTLEECPEVRYAIRQVQGIVTEQDELNYLISKAQQTAKYPGDKSQLEASSYLASAAKINKAKADAAARNLGITNYGILFEKYGDVAIAFAGDPLVLIPAGFSVLKAGFEGLTYIKAIGFRAGQISQALSQSKVMTSVRTILTQSITAGSATAEANELSIAISRLNPTIFGTSRYYELGKQLQFAKSVLGPYYRGIVSVGDELAINAISPSMDRVTIMKISGGKINPNSLGSSYEGQMMGLLETSSGNVRVIFSPAPLALPSPSMVSSSSAAATAIPEQISSLTSASLAATSSPAQTTSATSTFSLKLSRDMSELKPKIVNLRDNLGISFLKPQSMNRATLLSHLEKSYGRIYVLEDGSLIDGNTRLALARQLGIAEEQLPVVVAGYEHMGQMTVAQWKTFFETQASSANVIPITEEILSEVVEGSGSHLIEPTLFDASVNKLNAGVPQQEVKVSIYSTPDGAEQLIPQAKLPGGPYVSREEGKTMIYAKRWNSDDLEFEGRHLIRAGTRIQGGVFSPGGEYGHAAEAIVADFAKDAVMEELYQSCLRQLKILLAKQGSYEKIVTMVYKEIKRTIPYNKERAEILQASYGGKKVVLGHCIRGTLPGDSKKVGGVCRHQGLASAMIFERMIDEGYLPGCKSYFVLGYSHAWGAFQSDTGTLRVVDVAQNFVGKVQPNTQTYMGKDGLRHYYLKTGGEFPEGVGPFMQVALKQGEQELILNPRPEMIGLDDIDIVLRSKSFPEQIPDKLGKILAQRSSEIISRIRMMEGTQGSDLASAIEFSKSKTCTHDVLTCATNQRADMKLLKTAAERTLADPKTPYYLKRSIEDYLILLEILDDEDRVFELMYIADKLISAGEVETAYMMIIDNQQNILGLANHYFQNVPREFYQDPDLINLFSESDRFRAETWSKYDGGGLARYQKFRADLDSLLKSRDNVPSSVFLAGYRKLVQQLEYPRYLEDLIAYAKLERDGLRTVKGIFIIEGKPGKSNQLIYISKEDQAVLFDINPESFRESVVSYRLCPDKLEEAALNPRSRMNILLREGIDPRPIIQQIKSGALPKGIVNRVVKKFPTDHLRKIADEASDEAKKQAEDLILQLKKGDPSPGKGNEPLQETRFYYMRSENARVVIDRVGNNYYVVGICDKSQEDATFALLRSLKF